MVLPPQSIPPRLSLQFFFRFKSVRAFNFFDFQSDVSEHPSLEDTLHLKTGEDINFCAAVRRHAKLRVMVIAPGKVPRPYATSV